MMTGLLGVRALVQTLLVIEKGDSGADQTLCFAGVWMETKNIWCLT